MYHENITLKSAHVRAIFRIKWARDRLLRRSSLSASEWLEFESFAFDKKLSAQADAISLLIETVCGSFDCYGYPDPRNPAGQVDDPIKIYGARGVWLVYEDTREMIGKFSFFSEKKEAFRYANLKYREYLDHEGVRDRSGLAPYLQ